LTTGKVVCAECGKHIDSRAITDQQQIKLQNGGETESGETFDLEMQMETIMAGSMVTVVREGDPYCGMAGRVVSMEVSSNREVAYHVDFGGNEIRSFREKDLILLRRG